MTRIGLLAFSICSLICLSYSRVLRYQRESDTESESGSKSDYLKDADQLKNYPDSPVEAFFGTGAHNHHMPIAADSGPSPLSNAISIGGISVTNEFEPMRETVSHEHNIGGVDNVKQYGVNLGTEFDNYKHNLNDSLAARGLQAHPYYSAPTHFLGRSPFEHDATINEKDEMSPFTGHNNIMGFEVDHSYKQSDPYTTYTHNLGGVDPFKDHFNWTKHFGDFNGGHAQLVATHQAAASATHLEPHNEQQHISSAGNPFEGLTPPPATSTLNPFDSVDRAQPVPHHSSNPFATGAENPFFNPFLSRTK